jgi:hypothetical protein
MSFLAIGGTLIAGGTIGAGTIAAGGALLSAGTQIYGATQTNKAAQKAVDQQKQIQSNLRYEPIDIEKLKRDATATAIENATNSLALERQLTPNVAATRDVVDQTKLQLAQQVQSELAQGGNLSPDVINRVNAAGRVIGNTSGVGSASTVPLTAGLLGLTSMDLANQRRAAAQALQGPGASPTVGLDPGSVASAEVANNAAYNDFNMAKAGIDRSLSDSEAKARTAQIGGQTGMISSLSNLAFGAPQAGYGGLLTSYLNTRNPAITTGSDPSQPYS